MYSDFNCRFNELFRILVLKLIFCNFLTFFHELLESNKNAFKIFQNSEKPKNGLPKRWQKFDDLIYLPVGVELTEEELDQVLEKYKVSRIAQQEIIDDDDIRSPKAKILRQGLIL